MSQDEVTLEPLWLQFSEERLKEGNLNDHLDLPAIFELIPDGIGKTALDLGCGLGQSAFKLAEKMNYAVIAVDSSAERLERAKRLYSGNRINWIESTFEKLSIPPGSISVAVACLSFHFVADLQGLIGRCAEWLAYDGMLIFSVRHPIRTADPTGETQIDGELCWSVKNYFTEGPRHFSWLGSDCINYHRPLSAYFRYLHNAGFVVEAVAEPSTSDDRLTFNAESRSVPFLLTIASRKRKHP